MEDVTMAAQAPNFIESAFQRFTEKELSKQYSTQQKERESPLKRLLSGIVLIVSVAVAVFANLHWFPAVLIGLGTMLILQVIADLVVKKCIDQDNEKAAQALLSPGFFAFANQNPARNLSSATAINAAHIRFAAREPL